MSVFKTCQGKREIFRALNWYHAVLDRYTCLPLPFKTFYPVHVPYMKSFKFRGWRTDFGNRTDRACRVNLSAKFSS